MTTNDFQAANHETVTLPKMDGFEYTFFIHFTIALYNKGVGCKKCLEKKGLYKAAI